jgi:hypothetical protein
MSRNAIEIGYVLLIIALVFSLIQWLLVRFLHWSIALTATVIVAFALGTVYVQLKYATPNGSNYSIRDSEFVLPVLLVLGLFLCNLAGIYLLDTYLSKGTVATRYVYGWLGSYVALPAMWFVGQSLYNLVVNEITARQYTPYRVVVQHYANMPMDVWEVWFTNSKNNVTNLINPGRSQVFVNPLAYHPKDIRQKEDELMHTLYDSGKEDLGIPRNMDVIQVRWFSAVECKFYSQDYPVTYAKLNPSAAPNEKWTIRILVLNDGKVNLFLRDALAYQFPEATASELTEAESNSSRQWFQFLFPENTTPRQVTQTMDSIRTLPQLKQQAVIQATRRFWKMTIIHTGVAGPSVTIRDWAFNRYTQPTEFLEKEREASLPAWIEFSQQPTMRLYLDREKLYEAVTALTDTNTLLEIQLDITHLATHHVKVYLKTAAAKREFTDWQLVSL